MKPKPVSREMVTRGVHHDVIGISSAFQLQAAKAKDPEVGCSCRPMMASIERAGITKLSVITAR